MQRVGRQVVGRAAAGITVPLDDVEDLAFSGAASGRMAGQQRPVERPLELAHAFFRLQLIGYTLKSDCCPPARSWTGGRIYLRVEGHAAILWADRRIPFAIGAAFRSSPPSVQIQSVPFCDGR